MSSPPIAVRAEYLDVHMPPYFSVIFKLLGNLWSPSNTGGSLILAVAENKLQTRRMVDRLAAAPASSLEAFNYGERTGMRAFRAAVAGIFNRFFLGAAGEGAAAAEGGMASLALDDAGEGGGGSRAGGATPLSTPPYGLASADEVVIFNGVTGALEAVAWAIADEGESVLIPAPYYPAFDRDLTGRFGVRVLGFPGLHEAGDDAERVAEVLDAAAAAAERAGSPRVAAVLLTNPDNPTGTLYTAAQLVAVLRWAIARGAHVLSDEIYALTVHGPGASFTSARRAANEAVARGELDAAAVDASLHLMWGLSKDFGLSGIRLGAVWTRNASLLSALAQGAFAHTVPGSVQLQVADALADDAFVDAYVADNQRLLDASFSAIADRLRAVGVDVAPQAGAMFVWSDFSPWLLAWVARNPDKVEEERSRLRQAAEKLGLGADGPATGNGQGGAGVAASLSARSARRAEGMRHAFDLVTLAGKDAAEAAEDQALELAFWRALVEETGVVLSPGTACRASSPGYFRWCFAWVPLEAAADAADRVVRFLGPKPAPAA